MLISHRFIALDVETTGLRPTRGDRVIEIGAVVIQDDAKGDEFHSLIDVNTRITLAAQQIHGITNQMLEGKPGPAEVMASFREFIKDSTLVAHNAKFDVGFLSYEFLRLGIGLTCIWDDVFFCAAQT